jgi:hypothetical protein
VGDSLALLSNGELAWGSSECRGYPDWQCFGRVNRLTKGSDGFVNGSADEIESPLAGYRDWASLPLTTPPAPPRNSNGDGHGLSARLQTPASLVPLPNGSFVIVDADNGLLRLVGSLTGGATNTPPYASAGPDYPVNVNDRVILDGSGSGDEDNDALTYRWTLLSKPSASVAVLIDATAVTAVLVPDMPGIYRVQLVVNDGTSDSAPAYVEITALNRAPVANAGPDQAATLQGPEGQTPVQFVLNGTASSDPDGQTLTYQWTMRDADGSTYTITGANPASPELEFYDSGVHSVTLTVSDGALTSTDSVDIYIVNPKPVADAGPDQVMHFPGSVTLTGSATDPNGDTITRWSWYVSLKPAGAVATLGADQAQSTIFYADKPGRYEVQLAASDGWGWSAPDTVVVELTDAPPVAGPDVATSLAGNAVVLDLLANDSDADGDEFVLTATSAPGRGTLTLLDPPGAPPRRFVYSPTNPGDAGTDTFTYTITTVLLGEFLSSSATGTVTVKQGANHQPTAVADAASITVGGEITIPVLGNDYDADGDPIRLVSVTSGALGMAFVDGFGIYYRSSGTGGVDTLTYTIEDLDPYDSRVKSTSTGTIRVTVQNSPAGSNVQVALTTSSGAPTPVTITFPYVTGAGQTVANPITPPSIPSDTFQIAGVAYDISTTAAFTPPVWVCFAGTFGENDYLLHYVGGFWELLPNQQHLDPQPTNPPTYRQVCATTNSLSPFAIATRRSQTFTFTGFFNPVDNPPSVNAIKGGRAVPVKFSLGGDYGLSIFEAGYPRVERVACDTGAPTADVEETVTAGSSGLQYDAAAGIYIYVWKTTSSMAGGCWRLSLRFTDGTQRYALFNVKK